MRDIESFLQALIGGETDIQPRRPKLLPSQSALSDIGDGMMAAHEMGHTAPPIKRPPLFRNAAKGGLMGGLQGLSEITKAQPMQPMQDFGNPIRDQAIQNAIYNPMMMQHGGYLPPGYSAIVGDGTDDPNAMEGIYANPDGGVEVTPNPDIVEPRDTPITSTPQSRPLIPLITKEQWGESQQQSDPEVEALKKLYGQLVQNQQEKPSKWKDMGYGALQGAANWFNHSNQPIQSYSQMRTERKNAPIIAQIGAIEHQRKERADLAWRRAQEVNVLDQPVSREEERLRKIRKDNRDYDIKVNTLDWKKEDRDRYYELEDIKQKALERKDQNTYDVADRKEKELERHNKASEKLIGRGQDIGATSREKVAKITAGSRKDVADINATSREKVSANSQARLGMNDATRAAAVLAAIPKGMEKLPGEDIDEWKARVRKAQESYIQSVIQLNPDVGKKLVIPDDREDNVLRVTGGDSEPAPTPNVKLP